MSTTLKHIFHLFSGRLKLECKQKLNVVSVQIYYLQIKQKRDILSAPKVRAFRGYKFWKKMFVVVKAGAFFFSIHTNNCSWHVLFLWNSVVRHIFFVVVKPFSFWCWNKLIEGCRLLNVKIVAMWDKLIGY